MSAQLPIARLTVVYVFDCDNCGRENIVRPIRPEMDPEEEQQARDAFGLQPWEEGEFCTMPTECECSACGARYATKDSRAEDDEP